MPRPALALALLALLVLGGCASRAPELRVNGVSPSGSGALNLTASNGLVLTTAPENHTLALALAPSIQPSIVEACAGRCSNLPIAEGTLVADNDLVGLANLTLIARTAALDSTLNFYGPSLQGPETLRFSQLAGLFETSRGLRVRGNLTADDVLAVGNVTATRYLGTRTPLLFDIGGQRQLVTVSTAALEGAEVTVFARGSGQLHNGTARLDLPPAFVALAGSGDLTAQVTATSEGPALWVAEKATDHLLVRAQGGGGGETSFDWFVQAPRKGAEDFVV